MSKKKPLAKWVLPDVVDPPDRICYQISVPNNRFHKAAFFGALLDLASAYKWSDDPAHTAKSVALVWRDIIDDIRLCPAPLLVGGAGGDDENMIRQNPDNPCELQTSINGTDWCTFADFSLCLPAPAQPGGGTTQPPIGGGLACYQAEMQANSRWLLPTVVSSGDVIDLTNATGAGNDGTVSPWHCPDGSTFFAGACIAGTAGPFGLDPLPTANHMSLLYFIAGAYYDAMAGPFTVPGGITTEQVEVQVNDAGLSDNSGSYRFQVCVTNNQTGTWVHTHDLRISPGPWVQNNTLLGNPWAAGVGYSAGFHGGDKGVQIKAAMSSRVLTRITLYFTMTAPDASADWDCEVTAPAFSLFGQGTPAAGDQSQTGTGSAVATELIVSAFSSVGAGNVGDSTIYKVVTEGQGTDPF